jgi:hypothetical protein
MKKIKLGSDVWASLLDPTWVIVDPDGWDRKDLENDWKKPITFDEFENKVTLSTVCGFPFDLKKIKSTVVKNFKKML